MNFRRKCKVTFISHGSTINTEENRLFDDESYPPINSAGKYEMQKISEFIKNKGLKTDKIYSSPALRTLQSARIISEECKKDFEIIAGLTSRKNGIWSGMTYDEIEEKYPEMLDEYHKNPENFSPEKGENAKDYSERILKIINKTVEQNRDKRIIIVTHREVIRVCVADALGIPLKNRYKLYVPTGSATQISYYEGFASLVYSSYIPL